jgi:hypothetical protein
MILSCYFTTGSAFQSGLKKKMQELINLSESMPLELADRSLSRILSRRQLNVLFEEDERTLEKMFATKHTSIEPWSMFSLENKASISSIVSEQR